MFFESNIFLFNIIDFIYLMLIPLAFVGVKVLLLRYFEFMYSKKTLIHYGLLYGILTILMIVVYLSVRTLLEFNQIVSFIYLPFVIIAILYEYLWIHRQYFEYEPKGAFAMMMLLSYVAKGMVLALVIPIYILLLFLLAGIAQLF